MLKQLGRLNKPILLKRGLANTIEELLMSAEYIMAGGNEQVILCERGIRTYETFTRNTLDISAVPVIKKLSHLPVIAVSYTHLGRRVAKLLERQFCDLDSYIEQQAGMTVAEIFAKEGEAGFRAREAQAAEEVAAQKGMVIASGGGTVLSPRNVEAFHKHGAHICLLYTSC